MRTPRCFAGTVFVGYRCSRRGVIRIGKKWYCRQHAKMLEVAPCPSWYGGIEKRIRALVRVLRDNGYNTTHSCGHEMYVECEYYGDDLREVAQFLVDHNFPAFRITLTVGRGDRVHYACFTIWLPKPDGHFSECSFRKGTTDDAGEAVTDTVRSSGPRTGR